MRFLGRFLEMVFGRFLGRVVAEVFGGWGFGEWFLVRSLVRFLVTCLRFLDVF